jgi:hypothetical protein
VFARPGFSSELRERRSHEVREVRHLFQRMSHIMRSYFICVLVAERAVSSFVAAEWRVETPHEFARRGRETTGRTDVDERGVPVQTE